jgi:hypothetical protein
VPFFTTAVGVPEAPAEVDELAVTVVKVVAEALTEPLAVADAEAVAVGE